jgi:hypothetical protein
MSSVSNSRISHPALGPNLSADTQVHPLVKVLATQLGIVLVILLAWAVLLVVR